MRSLVSTLRHDLEQPRLPWLTVQLARWFGPTEPFQGWNAIQEQQRQLPDRIADLEVVAAIDLPLDDPIHLGAAAFPRLAARLARTADRLVYGNPLEKRPPQVRGIRLFKGSTPKTIVIEITYDSVEGGLRAAGEPSGFTLTDENGMPLAALYKTVLKGNLVELHSEWNPMGLRLHYGHGYAPFCNIVDGRDFRCRFSARFRLLSLDLLFGCLRFGRPF